LAENKYPQNIIKSTDRSIKTWAVVLVMKFEAAKYGICLIRALIPILKPFIIKQVLHKHNFHQFLCILSNNPKDFDDFDAEMMYV